MKKSILSFKAFINEELALVGPPGGPGMPQMGMPPGGMPAPGIFSKKGKKGIPQQPPVDPLKPQPYQGFTNTPETEERLRNLIVTQFDDPDTTEEEIPQDAKWQTLNTAQGNAYQREVNKLKFLNFHENVKINSLQTDNISVAGGPILNSNGAGGPAPGVPAGPPPGIYPKYPPVPAPGNTPEWTAWWKKWQKDNQPKQEPGESRPDFLIRWQEWLALWERMQQWFVDYGNSQRVN